MKNECDLIQDLLPLYMDDIASNKSVELIENHLYKCEECSNFYNELKKKKVKSESSVLWKLKRKITGLFIITVFTGILLAAMSTFCIYKENQNNFNSIYDWIQTIAFSIGIYFIMTLAVFVSFIYYKTGNEKNVYFSKTIYVFLVVAFITIIGFLIWHFISLI